MQISVIIVNYNVRVFLEHCLDSLARALQEVSHEIIVVDNASDDGSVEMIRHKYPNVVRIENNQNVGFGKANNQGARTAGGDILFFLNPDTVVQEDTIEKLVQYYEQQPKAGIVGCKVLNPDGTLQPACRRSFPSPWVAFTKISGLSSLFPRSRFFSRYNLSYLNPDDTHEVDAVSGACLSIRKTVFNKLGGFDEQFFMFGEDLDLCYRVKQAGWQVWYLPTTRIIHYKGESVRRSDMKEVRVFYHAMQLFVRKHFHYGIVADIFLQGAIVLREGIARLNKNKQIIFAVLIDYLFVLTAWFTGEWLRFGKSFLFPSWAYYFFLTIPPLIVIGTMAIFDGYAARKYSLSKTTGAVVLSFLIFVTLTYFFKEFAFSRFVILIAGILSIVFLVGWRQAFRFWKASTASIKRTLVVGTGKKAQLFLQKLSERNEHRYEVVGLIDSDRKNIGEKIQGIDILGCPDTITKIIDSWGVTDVIFSSDTLTYIEILSVISRSPERGVQYRLVPDSLEAIIGKTHIDELNDLPFVDIEYNVRLFSHRVVKRCLDLVVGVVLLSVLYPSARRRIRRGNEGLMTRRFSHLPKVIDGSFSLVGFQKSSNDAEMLNSLCFGKEGITGLAQVNNFNKLSGEEVAEYNVYYAKNQSLFLDLQILLKSVLLFCKE